ncbi:MAG: 4-hydroxythreonine-4-phosphate dehydrogenase PdxA [Victivallaceae bacterium]|nr:4-hydroxythreonine-4-phosphate dehydrogenase PdxA [Victivallaceae bacterium]
MVRIGLTIGDAAGIGPEIVVRLLEQNRWAGRAEFVVYGPPEVIEYNKQQFAPSAEFETVPTVSLPMAKVTMGKATAACGRAAFETLTRACLDAIAGKIGAMVTAPMNKLAVNLAGIPFTGHTERIAELCGIKNFAMMQSAGDFRVAFVTTHVALAEAPRLCTQARIIAVACLLRDACIEEGVAAPRLAAAAINPHAGENGLMGREDEDAVKPALEKLRSQGMNIAGPFPPDTLFIESIRTKFDGIVSMYHDQGHIPFKMLAFDRGVNSTLGLPIIRTSVDHGTAFEIAYKGTADLGSLTAAVELAVKRAEFRKRKAAK